MPRRQLTDAQRDEGRRLAAALRAARIEHGTPTSEVAAQAGLSIDTVRKLEGNGIAAPSFFTVARLARVLGLPLDPLAAKALEDP